MNLVFGEIVETFREADSLLAKVRVRGAFTIVALALTPDARPGDQVLICDGVALNRMQEETAVEDVKRE